MSDAEVAIIGGGPAGTATAIACAKEGARVVLLEPEPFPRHRPGETLHPGVEALLRVLGVEARVHAAGFLRHEGQHVTWGGATRFERFGADEEGPWRGFQAWRAEFDTLLLERARELGVEVCARRAVRPLLRRERVVGVLTSAGPIEARFTVDAGGGSHWLARRLGLEVEAFSPRLLARYGYAEGDGADCDDAPRLVGDSHGWTWTARVRPRLYHWTRLALGEAPASGEGVPPPCLAHLAQQGRPRGADVTWRLVRPCAGPGWLLAGDAAAVVDPLAAQGVLRALASGLMAAHCLSAIRSGRATEAHATSAYTAWLRGGFLHTVDRLRGLYAQLGMRLGSPTPRATEQAPAPWPPSAPAARHP